MEETASLYEASLQSPARAAKAARRLISVCRLLMFGAQVDALVELLSQEGAMLVALEARCELYQMLSAHRDSQVRAARVPLRATITALRESLAATSGSRRVRSSYGSLSQDERDRLQRFAEVARPLIDRTARQVRSELRMP